MSTQLSSAEQELAARSDFTQDVLSLLKETFQTELLHWSIDAYRAADEVLPSYSVAVRLGEPEMIEGAGFPVRRLQADGVFTLIAHGNARDMVLQLRPQLQEAGYIIALVGSDSDIRNLTRESIEEAEEKYAGQCAIGVLKGTEVCDFLRLQNTNGANFDLDTESIIRKLANWEQLCSLHIVGAGFDWVDLQFDTLPDNLQAFAEEIYDFCPDTLDQGYVGPDPTNGREMSEMSQEEMLQMVEQIGDAIDSQTPADLAEFLSREKRLWLWWD
ncbi:MAG TPA: DUF4253 domain-containing protein [Abditibacteriaceae bacterium]|jgi:hypothetical protein